MLDSIFVMAFRLFFLLMLALETVQPTALLQVATTPTATPALLLEPLPGAALRGSVSIRGLTALPGLTQWNLAFAYRDDPTHTWFLLVQSAQPVVDGLLYEWDTTTITDGVYSLRLQVALADGRVLTALAPELRLRNYTPIETNTPTPVTPTATPQPGELPPSTITPTPTITPPAPTPSPLPTNPAQIAPLQAAGSLAWGGGIVLSLFLLLGFYWVLRRTLRQALRRR